MDEINKIVKEIYSQYGLTMHYVQILETGLLELFAIKSYVIANLSEKEYYQILSNQEKLTLGKINNKLFGLKFLENETKVNLIKANKLRIFLAHRFWWERDLDLANLSELIKLLNELSSYIKFLANTTKDVVEIINKIRFDYNLKIEEKMGLTGFQNRENFIKSLNKSNNYYKQ